MILLRFFRLYFRFGFHYPPRRTALFLSEARFQGKIFVQNIVKFAVPEHGTHFFHVPLLNVIHMRIRKIKQPLAEMPHHGAFVQKFLVVEFLRQHFLFACAPHNRALIGKQQLSRFNQFPRAEKSPLFRQADSRRSVLPYYSVFRAVCQSFRARRAVATVLRRLLAACFQSKKYSPSSCVSAGKGGTEPESGKYSSFIQRGAAFFSP